MSRYLGEVGKDPVALGFSSGECIKNVVRAGACVIIFINPG